MASKIKKLVIVFKELNKFERKAFSAVINLKFPYDLSFLFFPETCSCAQLKS